MQIRREGDNAKVIYRIEDVLMFKTSSSAFSIQNSGEPRHVRRGTVA